MKINDALTRTITTIVEGLIEKAGFNRTRSSQIVGINPQTNTYSVRIDGQIYPNVPVNGNGSFKVGDITKVYIPNNQPSQMYMNAVMTNEVDLTHIKCQTLAVGDIDYTLTTEEYNTLLGLLDNE